MLTFAFISFRNLTRMSLEIKLQEASQDFQKLQIDLAHAIETRQQLGAQLSENKQVQEVIHGNLFKECKIS